MNKAIRQKSLTVAMITSQDMAYTGITCIFKSFTSASASYTYMERNYQVCPVPFTQLTKDGLPLPHPDVILLAWDVRYLEQGLKFLSRITGYGPVKENSIPLVFCLTHCCRLKSLGISADFQLLEDVLQIPVIPYFDSPSDADDVKAAIAYAKKQRFSYDCLDFSPQRLTDETLRFSQNQKNFLEHMLDKCFSLPFLGNLLLLLCFCALFYPAFFAARFCSQKLLFASLQAEPMLFRALRPLPVPLWLSNGLICGAFRSLACVISLMLPPLAFSLPLLLLWEESGFLSRLSFYGDPVTRRLGGGGGKKQCFSMAMGVCCHMSGICGCRCLKGKKERLSAGIANVLLPCGGRFSALLILFSLIFPTEGGRFFPFAALLFPGILATLCCSLLLSCTVFRKLPSSSLLELPPLHCPKLSSLLLPAWNHICFLLGRAGAWAVFAGLFIWFSETVKVNGLPLLTGITGLLDPFARLLGLDGVILAAFLLGSFANELIWPLILLMYLPSGGGNNPLSALPDVLFSRDFTALLYAHGWTRYTVLAVFFLTLFHWPCLPALFAIRKETGSARQTAAAVLIPTLLGLSLCLLVQAFRQNFLPPPPA